MKKANKLFCFILIVIMLVSVATGCGSGDSVHSEFENDRFEPSESVDDGYELTFVCPIIENPYWEKCINGIRRADNELGTHTTVIGPETADNFETEILKYIAEAVDDQPDGILAYAAIPAMKPYIEKAVEKGIPIIAVDADTTDDSCIAYVGADIYNLGYKAGEKMLELIGDGAKVGYICSTFDASNEKMILDAFCDATYDNNMQVVASKSGHNDAKIAKKATEELLKENPEITAIFCTGGYNVTGAGQYISENDLDIKLIGFEDVEENLELLREGAIDALLAQSPEEMGYISVYAMKEYLDKGTLSGTTFNTESVLITKDNIDTYHVNAFTPDLTLKDVRVGYYDGDPAFLSGTEDERKTGYGYEYLQAISTLAGWKYTYEYGTKEELLEKLRKGSIDLIAGVNKSENVNDEFLLSSADMGLSEPKGYFGVSRKRKDLHEELDGAMRKLQTEKPTYTANLYSKYYELDAGNNALTEAERSYLAQMDELRFGFLRGNLPICDEDSYGVPTGLAKNIVKQIVSFAGIPVKTVAFNTVAELEDALKSGTIDVAFPSYSDIWLNEKNHTKQTDPFVSDRVMILYSGKYTDDIMNSVAVAQSNIGQIDYMSRFYPESEVIYYENKKAVFDAIKNGEVKCTIGCSGVFQHFLFDHSEYDDLHIAYLDASIQLGLSVHEKNSYLISILNKTVSNMGAAKINSALLSYTGVEKTVTFTDFIRENSVLFILAMFVFIILIAMIFLVAITSSKKHQRLLDKTNIALANALETANKASKAKTEFLSTMSHDIRTPMNAILGMATLASQDPNVRDNFPYYLEKITNSGRHLLTLINDILDIAKIESGKLTLTPSTFSLNKSMHTLNMIAESNALEKDIIYVSDCADIEHDIVFADKVRMEQVFLNILSNAVKYTQTGGRVKVTVKGRYIPQTNIEHITFIVEDNGIGMSEQFMQKMYDSFARVEDSRISEVEGTGLGLAIVKQVVDLMNGTITCESKEGIGTRFKVELDLDTVEDDINTEETNVVSVSLEGLNVLVAEDNDLNWVVTSQYLKLLKIACERAVDGQDCIEILEASEDGKYDAVLMDVQMPRLNGKEATRLIRNSKRPYVRNIPVVAITADAFAEDIADCKNAGMNGHVSKPLDIDKIKHELQKVLSEISAETQASEDAAENSVGADESSLILSYEKLCSLFGNKETVTKLLQTFLSTHKDDCENLRKHIVNCNFNDARPILHSLIGVSGNLFMMRLYEASKKLRLEIHAEQVKSFDEFCEIWDKTISKVTEVCENPEQDCSE